MEVNEWIEETINERSLARWIFRAATAGEHVGVSINIIHLFMTLPMLVRFSNFRSRDSNHFQLKRQSERTEGDIVLARISLIWYSYS